jgi:hypothetical protein
MMATQSRVIEVPAAYRTLSGLLSTPWAKILRANCGTPIPGPHHTDEVPGDHVQRIVVPEDDLGPEGDVAHHRCGHADDDRRGRCLTPRRAWRSQCEDQGPWAIIAGA